MTVAEFRAALDCKPALAARKQLESQLQASCVHWFRLQYPEYALRLFAIPNGGQRGKIGAAMLKREGVLAGVPDLFLAIGNCLHSQYGLFIEMKQGKNKPSKQQLVMIDELENGGYNTAVVYSFEQFRTVIANYIGY